MVYHWVPFFIGPYLLTEQEKIVVACSSTEAEYRALSDTTSKLLQLRWLLQDVDISLQSSIPIYCDNHGAFQIAHNDVFYMRIKHIEIDCHFVLHHLQEGTFHLYSPSNKLAQLF